MTTRILLQAITALFFPSIILMTTMAESAARATTSHNVRAPRIAELQKRTQVRRRGNWNNPHFLRKKKRISRRRASRVKHHAKRRRKTRIKRSELAASLILLEQNVRPPQHLPGQAASKVEIRHKEKSLPRTVRAGTILKILLVTGEDRMALGKLIPESKRVQIVGQAPSGLLWIRLRPRRNIIVSWEVETDNSDKSIYLKGQELARLAPPGRYRIHAWVHGKQIPSIVCRITMKNPVCAREISLR